MGQQSSGVISPVSEHTDRVKGITSVKQPPAAAVSHFGRVPLFKTQWTAAHQVPLSMGFSRQGCSSGVAIPSFRRSSQPRDQSHISYVSCIGRQVLYHYRHLGSPSNLLIPPKVSLL